MIDATVRGDPLGAANAPDPAKAPLLLEATPSAEVPPCPHRRGQIPPTAAGSRAPRAI